MSESLSAPFGVPVDNETRRRLPLFRLGGNAPPPPFYSNLAVPPPSAAPPVGRARPIWNPNNVVGTSRLNDTTVGMPRGPFDPLVGQALPGARRPLLQSEAEAATRGSLETFGQLAAMDLGGGTAPFGVPAEATVAARLRAGRLSPPRMAREIQRLTPPEVSPLRPGEERPPLAPDTGTLGAGAVEAEPGERGMAALRSVRNMTHPEAYREAVTEAHIIPRNLNDPDGGFVGAPTSVRNREDLAEMRRRLDARIDAGAHGRDWYDRSREWNAEVTGTKFDPSGRVIYGDPNAARSLAEGEGVFSPQSNPDVNLQFLMQAMNARSRGIPIERARTGQQARVFNEGMAAKEAAAYPGSNLPAPPMSFGPKTDIFAAHLDPTRPPPVTGTNDIWAARGFGYTDPDGSEFSGSPTLAQHKFMDRETVLAVQRANDRQAGGLSNWNAGQVQAAPWIAMKEESLRRRFPTWSEEKIRNEALSSFPDVAPNVQAVIPMEQIPGQSTGLRGLVTPENRIPFSMSSWADPVTGRDLMTGSIMPVQPRMQPTMGTYINSQGELEQNPAMTAYPMVDFVPGSVPRVIQGGTAKFLTGTQYARGLIDMQELSPWNFMDLRDAVPLKDRKSMMLTGPRPTQEQLGRIAVIADKYGYYTSDTGPRGVMLINANREFDPEKPDVLPSPVNGKEQRDLLRKSMQAELNQVVPGLVVKPGAYSGGAGDLTGLLDIRNMNKGRATRKVLTELAKMRRQAPDWYEKVLDNPGPALKAQQNLARIDQFAPEMRRVRPDMVRMLELIAGGNLRALADRFAQLGAAGLKGLPALLAAYGLSKAFQNEAGGDQEEK